MATILLLACLGSTFFMTGLIWLVQLVHYPLLGEVGPAAFGRYHAEHVRRIGPLVGGQMLVELVSSCGLIVVRPSGIPAWLAIAGVGSVAITWISTTALQVPIHGRLASGFDPAAHQLLVRSNWVRTMSWTTHSAIVLGMAALALASNRR